MLRKQENKNDIVYILAKNIMIVLEKEAFVQSFV
jgi:hypothetical protein